MEIDFDKLRDDLIDYYGSAMMIYPVAVMDLTRVERSSEEELISIAQQNGFDLRKYVKQNRR